MSVDLEDYYSNLQVSQWPNYESRVEKTTQVLLDFFDKYKVQATFFTLGYIAEKHPSLIEKIVSKGHELSSHSYSHTDIRKMTPKEFEADLVKSLDILRKTSGEKVQGFRAPYFSIDKTNFWAFKIIKKYLAYDSSVFPVKTPLYGLPEAPRNFYKMSFDNPLIASNENDGLIELPLATMKLPIIGNLPIAGGFYLRFLPIQLIKMGIRKFNKSNQSAVIYIHPHDLDPYKPRLPENPRRAYWGLRGAKKKFESLLKSFKFSSARELIN